MGEGEESFVVSAWWRSWGDEAGMETTEWTVDSVDLTNSSGRRELTGQSTR